MKTETAPKSEFRLALEVAVKTAIKKAKAEGIIWMDRNNLFAITVPPSPYLEGAPNGTNAAYYYREMFNEVVGGAK